MFGYDLIFLVMFSKIIMIGEKNGSGNGSLYVLLQINFQPWENNIPTPTMCMKI